jgi:plasmid stability protein
MAMNLRLSEEETQALRDKAAEQGRSMQEVAREAIRQYTSDRSARLAAAVDRIIVEDAELLRRLGS